MNFYLPLSTFHDKSQQDDSSDAPRRNLQLKLLIFPRVTFRNAEVMPGRHLETDVHLNTVHKTRNTCQGNRQSFVTPGIKTYHAAQLYTSHCLYEQLELF